MAVARGSAGVARARLFGVGVTHSRTKRQAPRAPSWLWRSGRVLSEPVEETLPYRMRGGPLSVMMSWAGCCSEGQPMRRPARSRRQLMDDRACGKAKVSTRQLRKAAVNDDNGSSCCMCGRAGGVCLGGQSSDVSWVVTSASAATCPA